MRMSSACPKGRIPGRPGECVGENKGRITFCAPGEGKIREIFSSSKERSWGIRDFSKSWTITIGISWGFTAFLKTLKRGFSSHRMSTEAWSNSNMELSDLP